MTRPLQVYLDDADLERLERWSRERGWTKSHAVRVAIRALTRAPEPDPLLSASGMIEGLPSDGAERFDHYLNESYVAERPAAYRRRKARAAARVRR